MSDLEGVEKLYIQADTGKIPSIQLNLLLTSSKTWLFGFSCLCYIIKAIVYLVSVPTCLKRSNISHNAPCLSYTQHLCIHNKCQTFPTSKEHLYRRVQMKSQVKDACVERYRVSDHRANVAQLALQEFRGKLESDFLVQR